MGTARELCPLYNWDYLFMCKIDVRLHLFYFFLVPPFSFRAVGIQYFCIKTTATEISNICQRSAVVERDFAPQLLTFIILALLKINNVYKLKEYTFILSISQIRLFHRPDSDE
jgi:hypothetical protein